MLNFFIVASKCRVAPRVFNSDLGKSIIVRSIAIGTRHRGVNVPSLRSCVIARKFCSANGRNFAASASVPSSVRLNLSENNVLSSPFADVHGFTGTYLHDYVYGNLDRWPDNTALVCSATGRSYTYAETRRICGRLATSMRKSKLGPGDTIAAILPNVPEYPIVLLAASEAGLRVTLINPAYTADEIRIQLKSSNAAAVFTVPSKHSVAAASIADNPNVRLPIIVIEDGNGVAPEGTIKFADLVRDGIEEFSKTGEKTSVDTEDTFILPYSSGTSGLPKGVELSHRNLVANLHQLRHEDVTISIETTATHQDILPVILPIYHIYGLVVVLGLHLCVGGKLICLPQFSPDNFFKILEENRSSVLYLAPPLVQLLANDERLKRNHIESLRNVCSGAAPIGDEILSKFLSKAPPSLKVVQGYGLTECSPVISMTRDSPCVSTGCIIPNTQIRIVGVDNENENQNLGIDQVGEIYIRGPQVMKGYYKNPAATADCMEGDWFKTGDLGSFDNNGYLYIRGRLKELIKVKGYQVAPAEIENLIQGHSKVADAAVIGVPHEEYGEIPRAFVVPKNGATIEPDEIKEYVAGRVAKYKRLGDVQLIDKIPKSAAGKILRRELQKL